MHRRLLFVLLAIVVSLPSVFQAEAGHNIPVTLNPTNTDAGGEMFRLEVTSQGDPFINTWKVHWDPSTGDGKTLTTIYDVTNGKLYGEVTPEEIDCPDESVTVTVVEVDALTNDITTHSQPAIFVINNNPPIANDDEYTIDEDMILTADGAGSNPPGVSDNDSTGDDPSCGESLTATLNSQPSNGTVTLNADGTFTYTPPPNFNGTDTFTYDVSDGPDTVTGTVTINVTAINDVPEAVGDTYDVDEGMTLTADVEDGVLSNDSDLDGDTLASQVVNGPSTGTLNLASNGSFSYTPPDDDFFGSATFDYEACDPDNVCSTATVTIDVRSVNDPPVVNDDAESTTGDTPLSMNSADLLSNDTDADGDSLSVVGVSPTSSQGGTASLDGTTVTYTPPDSFSGTDEFTYTVSDGAETDTGNVTVMVYPASNNAPEAENQTVSTNEDMPFDVTLTATDLDSEALTFTVTNPTNGTLSPISVPRCSGTTCTATVTYTPNADHSADSFTFTVSDGSQTSTGTVNITVIPVNDAPSFTPGPDQTVDMNAGPQTVINWATDINPGAFNEMSQMLTFLVSNDNPALFAEEPAISSDGTLTFTPALDVSGVATLTVQLRDDGGTSNGGQDTSEPVHATILVVGEPSFTAYLPLITNGARARSTPGSADSTIQSSNQLAPTMARTDFSRIRQ